MPEVERNIDNAITNALKENKQALNQIARMYEIRGESRITSEQTIKTFRKQSVTLKRELEQVQTSRTLERRAASYVENLQLQQQKCVTTITKQIAALQKVFLL